MAMMTCPDCNGQLSDSAPTCPHCGRPSPLTAQPPRKVGILLGIGIFLIPLIFSWFTLRKGHTTRARTVSFVWLAAATIFAFGSSNYSGSPQSASSISSSHPARNSLDGSATASDIAQAYEENSVAADQRFKGKRFRITGTVADISTDFMGDPYLTLKGGVNQFMEPHFGFEKSSSDALASLYKGATVTLVCTGKGDVAKTPMWDSCTLQ
jgi:tRNA_anti-like